MPRSIRLLDKPGASDPVGGPLQIHSVGAAAIRGLGVGDSALRRLTRRRQLGRRAFCRIRTGANWCSVKPRQRTLRRARWRGWLMCDHCIVWACAMAGLSGCIFLAPRLPGTGQRSAVGPACDGETAPQRLVRSLPCNLAHQRFGACGGIVQSSSRAFTNRLSGMDSLQALKTCVLPLHHARVGWVIVCRGAAFGKGHRFAQQLEGAGASH